MTRWKNWKKYGKDKIKNNMLSFLGNSTIYLVEHGERMYLQGRKDNIFGGEFDKDTSCEKVMNVKMLMTFF